LNIWISYLQFYKRMSPMLKRSHWHISRTENDEQSSL